MTGTETAYAVEAPAPTAASSMKGRATKKAAAAPKLKKAKIPKPAGEKKPPTHPPTALLVNEAIGKLNERGGSSLQACSAFIRRVMYLCSRAF